MSDLKPCRCGKRFTLRTYNQRYCSPACRNAAASDARRSRRERYTCDSCGEEFERQIANRNTVTGLCHACSQAGEAHPRWKTGEHFHQAGGRWWVTLPTGGKQLRARFIMECHLGRPLSFNEVVHHRNEDPTDDRIENLEIMSRADHTRMHTQQRAAQGEMA